MEAKASYEGFAVLELMGHRRLAGWLSEQEIAGAAFLRIDMPVNVKSDGTWDNITQFYAPSAVYAITPTTQEVALEIAKQAPQPLGVWDVRALLSDIESEVKAQIENEVRREYAKTLDDQRERALSRSVYYDDVDDESEMPL